ncbi:MAG TPA: enoyl-ACP reductase FabV [Allosphingosinicella sp.]|nr:enoyl-ACP reductase FabV [Allosphingosinicella sp.]
MIVKPRIREFICTTAHPVGCAELVRHRAERLRGLRLDDAPKRVLVIGCSGGYGLATRIVTAFAGGADTIGVSMERAPEPDRTGSAGWYSNRAFEKLAADAGRRAFTHEGDAFSDEMKNRVADTIAEQFGQIDLLVYSLAAPARRHPRTGEVHRAVVKPMVPFSQLKTLDTDHGRVIEVSLGAATGSDLADTIAVMGGEDWALWVDALGGRGLLSPAFRTYNYTYIGADATRPIYGDGTIGRAKAHVEETARSIAERLGEGRARVVALKAIVTQASSAIPILPLYASLLRAVMNDRGGQEDAIDQILRLFRDVDPDCDVDEAGRIRLDEAELAESVQEEIRARWPHVTTESLPRLADFPGYRSEQLGLFGFGVPGIDYSLDVDPMAVTFAERAA